MHYITKHNLEKLLNALQSEFDVFVPVKKQEQRFYKRYDGINKEVVIGEVRAFEPLKAFFVRPREVVAEDFKPDIPHANDKPLAIVGVKACDLKGFKVQDHVFKGNDFEDPFYLKARNGNLVISCDCTCAIETCFCIALGVKPHPEAGYDINLSPVKGGFIIETGSKKGSELVEKNAAFFQEAKDDLTEEKTSQRRKVSEAVKENIKNLDIPDESLLKGIVEKKYESQIWQEEAKTCVECGACNTICPTCHCFLLYDQKNGKKMQRFRIWDSCMIKDFARVAGGANPRERLWKRLRNRFEKKFDYFPKVADLYACTGCGRCVSACPAKIDIRKVLKRLVSNA